MGTEDNEAGHEIFLSELVPLKQPSPREVRVAGSGLLCGVTHVKTPPDTVSDAGWLRVIAVALAAETLEPVGRELEKRKVPLTIPPVKGRLSTELPAAVTAPPEM